MSNEQIKALQSIGYDLDAKGKENERARWIEMFENVKSLKSEKDSWPKFGVNGIEGRMYNWCQAQRQAQAGTHSGGKRKPLEQWQVYKLESIEFVWNNKEDDKTWDEWFLEFSQLNIINGSVSIPSMINGKRNSLYAWWAKQKYEYKNGNLLPVYLQKLKDFGIDEEIALKSGSKDGFTKWANMIREIAEFINKNNNYPKNGKDRLQSNLYQSLSRTKRAFKDNKLTDRQLKLLHELKIELN
ncbi:hypothetical protein HNP99_002831 [Flavobacterium sp. 28A]|nr:hypothetical protein [Flavobacterium sp. 28A]